MTVDQWLGAVILVGVVCVAVSEIALRVRGRRIAGVVFKVKEKDNGNG